MTETHLEGIPLVSDPTRDYLNERQVVDYRSHRHDLLNWTLYLGKDPSTADGYAHGTVKARSYRLDAFYRWVWDEEGAYTTNITHGHADAYIKHLAYSDASTTHKANSMKAIKMLFKWQKHERDGELWEPAMTFSNKSSSSQPRDFLTRKERKSIREAALQYGSVPSYTAISATERLRWKRLLAQRFQMPLDDVGKQQFERANGFKIPSLVWVSLDGGLRPVEVNRAKVQWVDVENEVLRIPASESAKGDENWTIPLRSQTATMLDTWLDERALYSEYEDTDALWLTREGNPYQSRSLRYLLHRLCEQADINTENRKMSWYVIRHSTGTYMSHERGLAAAQSQLRHTSSQTTMKYDNTPIEDRRDALDKMG